VTRDTDVVSRDAARTVLRMVRRDIDDAIREPHGPETDELIDALQKLVIVVESLNERCGDIS